MRYFNQAPHLLIEKLGLVDFQRWLVSRAQSQLNQVVRALLGQDWQEELIDLDKRHDTVWDQPLHLDG